MAWALSIDIRERIVAYKEEGKTDAEIAEALKIGDASVSRVLRRFRETGGVAPAKDKGRRPFLLDDEDRAVLVVIVEAAPDSTLSELVDELFAERGKKVSEATMGRELRRCGFTRKKDVGSAGTEPRTRCRASRTPRRVDGGTRRVQGPLHR